MGYTPTNLGRNRAKPFRVALVTAARNEAAYIAEWVHHHLYFGFDPIEVHVNRSTDQTYDIVAKIAKEDPRVSVHLSDHIDVDLPKGGDIQLATFKAARHRLTRQFRKSDYLCFLDVDEFWTPVSVAGSVQDVLSDAGMPKVAAFNWFNRTRDVPEFGPALASDLFGKHHWLVKTCFQFGVWARRCTVHGIIPWFPFWGCWTASGQRLGGDGFFRTQALPTDTGHALILHRFYRSPLEYLAVLGRMRPRDLGLTFKDNRDGWDGAASDDPETQLHLSSTGLSHYQKSLESFVAKIGLEDMHITAKRSVVERARLTLQTYRDLPETDKANWARQFSNLDIKSLSERLGLDGD